MSRRTLHHFLAQVLRASFLLPTSTSHGERLSIRINAMESLKVDVLWSWPSIVIELSLAVISVLVYRRYLSPLSRIPGPFFASFSRFWHIRQILAGDQNTTLTRLHDQHGTAISFWSLVIYVANRLRDRSFRPHCAQ